MFVPIFNPQSNSWSGNRRWSTSFKMWRMFSRYTRYIRQNNQSELLNRRWSLSWTLKVA